ncbi:unnamed protein product [Ophioblennius macclurei]
MLRSTGFFRGIECPFQTENGEAKGVRNGCNRPYCLFRHSGGTRANGTPNHRGKRDVQSSARTEQGYDPFHPEVVSKHEHQNDEPPGDLSGELEMVNKAIEEVRCEMEREKRKLSRIGDEPYDPSQSALGSSADSAESGAAGSHLAYDPGSYEITTAGYNPAPGCSKYTLDSDNQRHDLNSMEYVPTSVKKPSPRTSSHQPALSSQKYSNSITSSKSKYTLENSRPSTDMEYDPMSNFSARITGKNKRDVKPHHAKSKTQKTLSFSDEESVVPAKIPRLQSASVVVSDSGEESSVTEYRPSSLTELRKSSGGAVAEMSGMEKVHKLSSSKIRSSSSSSSSSKDAKTTKSSNKDSAKKENKSHAKGDGRKNTAVETSREVRREGKDGKKYEDKIKAENKIKTDRRKPDRDRENGAVENKSKKEHRDKERTHKNGKLESSKRGKDEKKISKSSSGSQILANPKDAVRKSSGSSGKKLSHKRLSLSHADLFGDESPDESHPIMDYEDNSKGALAGHSPRAVKSSSLLKKSTTPSRTRSSSEDEGDDDDDRMEHSGGSGNDHDVFDASFFEEDLDFRSDPLEECLRIFNESNDVKLEDKGRQAKQASGNLDEKNTESTLTTLFPGQKKRVSHCVAKGSTEAASQPVFRPPKRLSAQEVCYQRIQKAQEQAAQLTASVGAQSDGSKKGKKRIAYLPSSQMTSAQTSSASSTPAASRVLFSSQNRQVVKSQTTAGILSKTSSTIKPKRVAHTPTMKSTSLKRPVIPSEFGAKVPTIIRQRYLNNFIDECLKFCPTEGAAHNMALEEEKLVYDRSSTKKIYLNIAVNTLKKLRSQSSSSSLPATKSSALVHKKKPQSHQDVLGGRLAATTSFTLNRRGKQQEEKLIGATLYRKLKSYLMTEEQLLEHGYPRVSPEAPGRAIINVTGKKVASDPFTKICCRCGAEYKINVNGNCVRKEECCYHWGRLRPQKVAGGWERMYSCCSAAVGVPGCQISQQHVQDGRKESLDGYVSTFSKPLPIDGNAGMFALDCEMCYTKQGLELTRVTVINAELKVIYDTFVKPDSKVVDYNTRFSGVTKEDLEDTTVNLRDVQAVLLSMFSAESILVGHSLESDLVALKLIHSTVVDTAIVFPHRLGLPYKRALKNLMADHLKRIIQDDVGGHDSSEDASACMELMIWKIKEDAKVKM